MVAVLLRLPEVPVTVTVEVPMGAVPVADRVKMLAAVVGLVPKLAVIPVGRPEVVKFTLPLKPFKGWTVIVVEPDAPCTKARLEGAEERVKLGCDEDEGQLLTKLAALTVPMPVAKSQPTLVPKAGAKAVLEVESTPTEPPARKQLGPMQSTFMSPEVTS
jgi:hypothetical protein